MVSQVIFMARTVFIHNSIDDDGKKKEIRTGDKKALNRLI